MLFLGVSLPGTSSRRPQTECGPTGRQLWHVIRAAIVMVTSRMEHKDASSCDVMSHCGLTGGWGCQRHASRFPFHALDGTMHMPMPQQQGSPGRAAFRMQQGAMHVVSHAAH